MPSHLERLEAFIDGLSTQQSYEIARLRLGLSTDIVSQALRHINGGEGMEAAEALILRESGPRGKAVAFHSDDDALRTSWSMAVRDAALACVSPRGDWVYEAAWPFVAAGFRFEE